jgi:hypothetical protein
MQTRKSLAEIMYLFRHSTQFDKEVFKKQLGKVDAHFDVNYDYIEQFVFKEKVDMDRTYDGLVWLRELFLTKQMSRISVKKLGIIALLTVIYSAVGIFAPVISNFMGLYDSAEFENPYYWQYLTPCFLLISFVFLMNNILLTMA